MSRQMETAFFSALANFKGQVDGRALRAGTPCDLSGTVKGLVTATDIIAQLEADTKRTIPQEIRVEVLQYYTDAYNKALKA